MRYVAAMIAVWLLTGCFDQGKKIKYDGETLIEEKCAVCHNLKMPPSTYEDEKAPPMMAVVFHLKDFMKITMDDEKYSKFIPFVQDYVIHPSAKKSYCDKESLKTYGVMPSQKGNVTEDELEAIASYMYDFYDQQKYLKQMQAKADFDALPKGEQIARKNGCFNCHSFEKKGVGPSFSMIAKRDAKEIKDTIANGSHGKWEGFHVMMPAFKSHLTQEHILTLQQWIQKDAPKKQETRPVKNTIETPWKVKK
ncbi:hypothetical protein MNB_SV-8-1325 [hydrothermal vent metagenome]|uniref:Cytochrome c domain-containing protein n=1 Tax=hydrothermal vent metagenome TaxID=652676 RepID=A0A1W1BYV3_9ZZZZ